jgi:hypothetical protein
VAGLVPLVTLHVWELRARSVPAALARVALDRRRLRRLPGVRFAKLLGTGGFRQGEVDLRRWALLVSWDDALAQRNADPVLRGWRRLAVAETSYDLRPLRTRGRWSGVAPFGPEQAVSDDAGSYAGPVAVLTRARLRVGTWRTFWAAVPAQLPALAAAPGLRFSMGVGEAPVGLQGTFSVWDDTASMTGFARGSDAHRDAVRRTPEVGWYAEECFTRLAVLDSHTRRR